MFAFCNTLLYSGLADGGGVRLKRPFPRAAKKAPGYRLTRNISDYRGKLVVLGFWVKDGGGDSNYDSVALIDTVRIS